MFTILPFILIIGGLAAAVAVVIRRFPHVTALDVSAIPEVREEAAKKHILQQRVERKFGAFFSRAFAGTRELGSSLRERVAGVKGKLHQARQVLEKTAAARDEAKRTPQISEREQGLRVVLTEAEELAKQERYPEAEQKYIEAISIDPKHVEAYRGLGELYLFQNEFEQAKETFAYITKLNPSDHQAFFELAEVYERIGDAPAAIASVRTALEFEPEHMKYLDFLLHAQLQAGDRRGAQETLDQIGEINPENAKLASWQEEIDQLQ